MFFKITEGGLGPWKIEISYIYMVKSSENAIGPTPLDQPPLIRACVAYRHAITCKIKSENR